MNMEQRTVRGVIWSLARAWGRRAISTIVVLVLAGLLRPEDFGVVAYASVIVTGVQAIMDLGLSDAIVHREDLRDEHLFSAFWLGLVVGALFFVAMQFFAGPIAGLLNEPQIEGILRWLSLVFILGGVSVVPQALLQRDLAFKELAIRELSGIILGGVTGVSVAVAGGGPWSLVAQQLVWAFTLVVALWMLTPWRPRFVYVRSAGVDLLRFGVHRIGSKALRFANSSGDDFLVGLLLGTTALGYYTIAYRVVNIAIDAFVEAVNAVAFPALARITAEDDRFRGNVTNGVGVLTLISFPAFAGILVIGGLVIGSFLKPEWLPATPVLRGLAFMGIAATVGNFSRAAILSYGRAGVTFALQAIGAAGTIIAIFVAAPFGIEWVGIAIGIAALLVLPADLVALARITPVRLGEYVNQVARPLLAATGMALCAFLALRLTENLAPAVSLIIVILVGVVTYLGLARWLAREHFSRAVSAVRMAFGATSS